MGEPKQYRIESLNDFLRVPEDRLLACLEEFVDWLEITRRMDALVRTIAPDHPADQPILTATSFVWIDDGARNMSMTLRSHDDTSDLMRVHWPEGGTATVETPDAEPPHVP